MDWDNKSYLHLITTWSCSCYLFSLRLFKSIPTVVKSIAISWTDCTMKIYLYREATSASKKKIKWETREEQFSSQYIRTISRVFQSQLQPYKSLKEILELAYENSTLNVVLCLLTFSVHYSARQYMKSFFNFDLSSSIFVVI